MIGCHGCVCVCVCARVCVRYYYGFVFKSALQSTAVQEDEAPKSWALLRYPQCSARWLIYHHRGENERKTVGLNVPHPPKKFFIYFFNYKSLLSLNLFCPKRENKTEAVLCVDDGKLYCDMLLSWLWEPHGCTSLSLCAGKGNCSRNRFTTEWKERSPRWQVGHCDEKRERSTGEKLQEWYEIFIMW